jgi:hypothetical protein
MPFIATPTGPYSVPGPRRQLALTLGVKVNPVTGVGVSVGPTAVGVGVGPTGVGVEVATPTGVGVGPTGVGVGQVPCTSVVNQDIPDAGPRVMSLIGATFQK